MCIGPIILNFGERGKKEYKKKKMEEDIGVNSDHVKMWTSDFYFLHIFSPFSNIFYNKHSYLT